jgi:hypothetical protein
LPVSTLIEHATDKRAGSIPDAYEIIKEYARAHGAVVGADDITVEM